MTKPLRSQDFELEHVGDELVLVAPTTGRVHALNQTAAAVWEQCDGTRNASDIATAASSASGLTISQELAELTIAELSEAGLFQSTIESTWTRRTYLQRFGQAAAVGAAMPVIHSIVAPSPAAAQSPGSGGGSGSGTTTPLPTTTNSQTTPPPTTTNSQTTPPPTTTGFQTTPPPTTTGFQTTPPPTTTGFQTTPPPTTTGFQTTPPPTTTIAD